MPDPREKTSAARKTPLGELRSARLKKLSLLRERGIDPFPSRGHRSHYSREVLEQYDALAGREVTVCGRLMSWRTHGAITFGHLQDQEGRIQLFLREKTILAERPGELSYQDLKLLDLGDIVEATGPVVKTRRGEISVCPRSVRLLTKALRPLPDKWSGLKDRESVLRRRYLDLTVDPAGQETFRKISEMLSGIRSFLAERGYVEFLTPVLQPLYGGGTARPFVTHCHALKTTMYLSISHELYLKRLIAAGFDRVFTIGRYFRNEGIDRLHHPEFSMLETMAAYENYEYNMDLVEDLFCHIARTVFGRMTFRVGSRTVDFARPWARKSVAAAVREVSGIDLAGLPLAEANAFLRKHGLDPQPTVGHALHAFCEERVIPATDGPLLLYGHPVEVSPLAKPMKEDPRYAERFEIIIGGMECGDNWSEQNDPEALLRTWLSAGEGDEEQGHPVDYDFLEMLEHGMPPTTGIGPGIERMAMIFLEKDNIDDVVFFPMLKPTVTPANAEVWNIPLDLYESRDRRTDSPCTILDMEDLEDFLAVRAAQPGRTDSVSAMKVVPSLHLWPSATPQGRWRASGELRLTGLPETLVISGYRVVSESPLDREAERGKLADLVERTVIPALKRHFPGAEVEVTPVQVR